jgi:hypothetical protein
MTNQEWVEYYQNHPEALVAFIETANQEYDKLLEKFNQLKKASKEIIADHNDRGVTQASINKLARLIDN